MARRIHRHCQTGKQSVEGVVEAKLALPAFLERHFGMRAGKAGYCLRSILSVGDQKKTQITTYFPPDVGARLQRSTFPMPSSSALSRSILVCA
jgi:hypothetical protein